MPNHLPFPITNDNEQNASPRNGGSKFQGGGMNSPNHQKEGLDELMVNQDGRFDDLDYENLPPGQRTYERNMQMQQNSAGNPEVDADGNQRTYVCNDEECGKVFFDQGNNFYTMIKYRVIPQTLNDTWRTSLYMQSRNVWKTIP